jgi:hypothetical protein
MNKNEQLEYNQLCAKLLGATPEQWYSPNKDNRISGVHWSFPFGNWYPNNQRYHPENGLNFHSDWNWIMEIISKIESIEDSRYYVSLLEQECSIIDKVATSNEVNPFMIEPVSFSDDKTKKDAVVKCIYHFLKNM